MLNFVVLKQKNISAYEVFAIGTGAFDLKSLGEIQRIYEQNVNRFWPLCPKDDTNSHGFGKFDTLLGAQEADKVAIYDWTMRRPIPIDEVLNKRTNAGRTVRKFVRSEHLFASSKEYPKYKCYRPEADYDRTDIFKGESQLGPIVAHIYSEPHFWAEKSGDFGKRFEGLRPNQFDHQSFIEIKADSGELLYERINLQINIDVSTSDRYGENFVWPFYWKSSATVRNRS